MLFRGSPMRPEWLNGWREMVGRKVTRKGGKHFRPACIKLPGNISTTKSFKQAIACAHSKSPEFIPVLFVISVRNYLGYHAFRMSDDRYTAFPEEQEFLLMDGIFLWVIKVEDILVQDWEQDKLDN